MPLTRGNVLHLQRLAGNRAVGSRVSARLPGRGPLEPGLVFEASPPTHADPQHDSPPDRATNHPLIRPAPIGRFVQRQVGPDLVQGQEVFDIIGSRGIIRERVFDPRSSSVRYVVDFIGETREVNALDLFLTDPGEADAVPLVEDDDSLAEGGAFDSGEDPEPAEDGGELLAAGHAREKDLIRKRKALKKLRPGKSPQDRDLGAKKSFGDKAKDFFKRTGKSLVVKPPTAADLRGGYSDRGTLAAGHRGVTKVLDSTIGQPILTPIESSLSGMASAATGTNRREGRTPGTAAKVEQKAGHVLSALGNLLQMVPVIGAASGPISGAGTFLQEHSAGASKKQALVKAGAATVGGGAAGLIPGYGTYSGMVSLINDCRKLASSVEVHGDPAYAHSLIGRAEQLEQLLEEMQDSGLDPKTMEAEVAKIQHEIDKANARYDKEMRRREKQERGPEGAKTGLLEEDRMGSFRDH